MDAPNQIVLVLLYEPPTAKGRPVPVARIADQHLILTARGGSGSPGPRREPSPKPMTYWARWNTKKCNDFAEFSNYFFPS